jgi:hypothetical protein
MFWGNLLPPYFGISEMQKNNPDIQRRRPEALTEPAGVRETIWMILGFW